MSVRAGRGFLLLAGLVFVASVAWIWIVWAKEGPWSSATTLPAVLGLVSVVCLSTGALLFSRFVDTSIAGEVITIRYVLGPIRSVPLSGIDEVVLLERLDLPARTRIRPTPRVLLRCGDRTALAFTPRDLAVVQKLASRSVQPTVIREPLSPLQAARRYRNSVSLGELISSAMVWVALVIPAIVLVWALWKVIGN